MLHCCTGCIIRFFHYKLFLSVRLSTSAMFSKLQSSTSHFETAATISLDFSNTVEISYSATIFLTSSPSLSPEFSKSYTTNSTAILQGTSIVSSTQPTSSTSILLTSGGIIPSKTDMDFQATFDLPLTTAQYTTVRSSGAIDPTGNIWSESLAAVSTKSPLMQQEITILTAASASAGLAILFIAIMVFAAVGILMKRKYKRNQKVELKQNECSTSFKHVDNKRKYVRNILVHDKLLDLYSLEFILKSMINSKILLFYSKMMLMTAACMYRHSTMTVILSSLQLRVTSSSGAPST